MAPYWSAASATAPRGRRASSAGSSSTPLAGPLGRKTSSAGEAYQRVVAGPPGTSTTPRSTRNPLYGMAPPRPPRPGVADSVEGSASDDTSGSSSRHYVDPWDLENFMYLKRHWAAEDAEAAEASSTPAIETTAQSDFYYVGGDPELDADLDVYPSVYRPDSVLLAEEHPLMQRSVGLLNAVEEESFFNERYDPARHHRLVRRSHSAAANYLHGVHGHLGQLRDEPRAASVAAAAAAQRTAYTGRRRSVACTPRYYRTPITGGDSSGEYEAFEDYADELSRRLGAVDLKPGPTPGRPGRPRSKRHSVAVPPSVSQVPRSRASIAGPPPTLVPTRLGPPGPQPSQPVRRRHSHCVGWPAPAPAAGPAHIYSTRRASFSRGQLLAGLHGAPSGHAGSYTRYASDLAYGTASAYGPPSAGPYGTARTVGTAGGSSDDCYASDASDDLAYGEATTATPSATPGAKSAGLPPSQQGVVGVPRRDAVVDGFTDADLVYAQLASSLYGDTYGYGYTGYAPSYDCNNRFQLTNYGHLKIDYSCSWRSLDHYIAHS